jgi:hypothetical protein
MFTSVARFVALFAVLAITIAGSASAQDEMFMSESLSPRSSDTSSPNPFAIIDTRPPLKLSLGAYCDYYDGYYDSSGEFQDYSGREKWGMYFVGGSYRFAEIDLGEDKRLDLSANARLTAAMTGFKSDQQNGFDESTAGLQSFTLGVRGLAAISPTVKVGLGITTVIDIGSEDDQTGLSTSDGSSSIGLNLSLGTRLASGLGLRGSLYYANELDSDYWDDFAFVLRGDYPVVETDALILRAGVDVIYHKDIGDFDGAGYLVSGGVHGYLDLKNSPLSFKVGGGCTEEWIPTGNFGFLGENYWQNKSLSGQVNYKIAF